LIFLFSPIDHLQIGAKLRVIFRARMTTPSQTKFSSPRRSTSPVLPVLVFLIVSLGGFCYGDTYSANNSSSFKSFEGTIGENGSYSGLSHYYASYVGGSLSGASNSVTGSVTKSGTVFSFSFDAINGVKEGSYTEVNLSSAGDVVGMTLDETPGTCGNNGTCYLAGSVKMDFPVTLVSGDYTLSPRNSSTSYDSDFYLKNESGTTVLDLNATTYLKEGTYFLHGELASIDATDDGCNDNSAGAISLTATLTLDTAREDSDDCSGTTSFYTTSPSATYSCGGSVTAVAGETLVLSSTAPSCSTSAVTTTCAGSLTIPSGVLGFATLSASQTSFTVSYTTNTGTVSSTQYTGSGSATVGETTLASSGDATTKSFTLSPGTYALSVTSVSGFNSSGSVVGGQFGKISIAFADQTVLVDTSGDGVCTTTSCGATATASATPSSGSSQSCTYTIPDGCTGTAYVSYSGCDTETGGTVSQSLSASVTGSSSSTSLSLSTGAGGSASKSLSGLTPGTYSLSVSASPGYAIPNSTTGSPTYNGGGATASIAISGTITPTLTVNSATVTSGSKPTITGTLSVTAGSISELVGKSLNYSLWLPGYSTACTGSTTIGSGGAISITPSCTVSTSGTYTLDWWGSDVTGSCITYKLSSGGRATAALTLDKSDQAAVTLAASATSVCPGNTVKLTAAGGSGSGDYSWSVSSTTGGASATLSSTTGTSVTATFAKGTSTTGTVTFSVFRKADTSYNASSSVTKTITVSQSSKTPTLSVALSSSSMTYGGTSSITATATLAGLATSGDCDGGTLQFMLDGTTLGTVTIASDKATYTVNVSTLTAGTHTVTAVFSGYAPSTGCYYYIGCGSSANLTISKRSITYTSQSPSKVYDGTVLAVSSPTVTSGSLASGDTATFSSATVTSVGPKTGSYTTSAVVVITKGSTDVTSSYNITYVTGTAKITSASNGAAYGIQAVPTGNFENWFHSSSKATTKKININP
jgi:trimeric autotransporter adhesin